MHTNRHAVLLGIAGLLAAASAQAQTWTKLATAPSFSPSSAMLLTDGTVMVHDIGPRAAGGANWWRLTPDNTGSYVNGTWSQLASLPRGYSPLYFASAVLPDGRVIINGGEYNGTGTGVWTTDGAIYDPLANTWTSVAPPAGWSTIGDAQSVVLANGTYMLANCCTSEEATLNLSTMAWTATGAGKVDINDEEGWTLLADGTVLTVDANDTADLKHTERLANGTWAFAGDTPVQLPDTTASGGGSHELGPMVLRPNNTVFASGATGHSAVFSVATHSWSTGPDFPVVNGKQLDVADGPAMLLPDGNVLVGASPGIFGNGVQFYEFDGTKLNAAPGYASATATSSYTICLLMLPTGQVLSTNFTKDVEIYTPTGTAPAAYRPVISNVATNLTRGTSYLLSGKKLNGLSQAAGYGDDNQQATNYPLVRITNTATGHVGFARTSGFSSMAVRDPAITTANFVLPASMEAGASTLVVVTNGIASKPVSVTVN